ncbi:hypothetical protein PIB30_074717 [Stylosanthes scabra]|uniref:SKP1 component POZ domain-containing protein n=1 Tax=Stylosanthes scabra TaxID=79078 RepID=A0ABU6TPD5_9FABA|nr:hypothetical protein [Stylosanthes scabra]
MSSTRKITLKHIIDDCADSSIPLSNVTIKILAKVIEYCKNTLRLQTLKKSPTRKKLWACWQLVKTALSPDRIAAHARASLLLGRLGVLPLLLMGVRRKHRGACSRRTQRSFSLLVEYSGSALHFSPWTRFILVIHVLSTSYEDIHQSAP